PEDAFDVARFQAAAAAALADIAARGRAALVVGGTGLWVRVLLHGLCPAPPRVPAVRAALRALAARCGVAELHRRLAHVDPAGARSRPRAEVRLGRALEVAFASGRRLSAWQAEHGFAEAPYDALVVGLGLPVAELDARIARRVQEMVAAGFADEVAALRARIPDSAPAWASVGYREMRGYVEGACDLAQALAATVLSTRRFAKPQRTWFRAEPGVGGRHPAADRARVTGEAQAFLARGARPPA